MFGLAAVPDGAVARDVVVRFFVPEQALPFHSFSQVTAAQRVVGTFLGLVLGWGLRCLPASATLVLFAC
mgnify:CR=1 FL=1